MIKKIFVVSMLAAALFSMGCQQGGGGSPADQQGTTGGTGGTTGGETGASDTGGGTGGGTGGTGGGQ